MYDKNFCYVYTGTEIYNIGAISLKVSDRSIINSIDDISYDSTVELNNIDNTFSFIYAQPRMLSTAKTSIVNNLALLSTPIYFECGVKFVSQNPPSNMYGLSYTYKAQAPSDGVMLKNIKNNYPISATFKWSSGYHDVVIYGINVIGGYIYIMDPEYGFCSASATSSGYKYTSGYSGVQLSLNRAACRYWTV